MGDLLPKPNSSGYFGRFGGQYVPETLMKALAELETAYNRLKSERRFQDHLNRAFGQYVGRPTPLYLARQLTQQIGGAKIYLKREDLTHTGAHKINNTVGQVYLAQQIGKTRIIAETGAGQHGVATAAACARLGLACRVYMGAEDTRRQRPNLLRMKLMGAEVIPVESGSKTLKDAINEAIRDWVTNVETTHYCIGSVVGPHPYPMMVRDFQSVIGRETKEQLLQAEGRLPDVVIACVGGGSNAIGMFYPFLPEEEVKLIGVEAGGEGLDTDRHSATLVKGSVGSLHGAMSYLLQDADGQIHETHSVSAGLDYPGVGPEHAYLKDAGRVLYTAVTDQEALEAVRLLSRTEGIIPALESAHAVAHAVEIAGTMSADQIVVINLSGRGDKDLDILTNYF